MMSRKSKQRPKKSLHDFPSSQGTDGSPVHWRKSRQRLGYWHYLKRFLQVFVVLLIVGAGVVGAYLWSFTQNNALQALAEEKLAAMVGSNIISSIKKVDLSVGGDSLLNVTANDLDLKSADTQLDLLQINKLSLGVSSLGLLQGKVNLDSINVSNVSLDLPPKKETDEEKDKNSNDIKPVNFEASFKVIYKEIDEFLKKLEENDFKELTLKNVKITGFKQYGLNSDVLVMESLVARKKLLGDLWELEAEFNEGGKKWNLDATWEQDALEGDNAQKHLDVNFKDLALSEFINNDFSNPEVFAVDGKVQLALNISFNGQGVPSDATAQLKLSSGKFQIPDEEIKTFEESVLDFKIQSKENKVILVSSDLRSGKNHIKLTGDFDFNGTKDSVSKEGATSSQMAVDFQISSLEAVADADNVGEPAVPFILEIKGAYLPNTKVLDFDELKLNAPDGSLQGAGQLDFNGETPALKLDLTMPKMTVATFKQLWPYSMAAKARAWVFENVNSGSIKDASLKANIPHGILGRIRKGAVIEKDQLNVVLPISDGNFRIIKELPVVEKVKTTLHVDGLITNMKLAAGYMVMQSKRKLQLANSTVRIGSVPPPNPNPISIVPHIHGEMSDILQLVEAKPIAFKLPAELSPQNIKGQFDGSLFLDFFLEKEIKPSDIKWHAEFDVLNFASKKPISGETISSSELHVKLNKTSAEITGKANINGLPAVVNLVEPFGNSKVKRVRTVTILADAKVRKSLGINLDDIVNGVLPLTVTLGDKKNAYHVKADLKNAKLSLPWVNWSKGKGIAGKLDFDYSKKDKKVSIDNFHLKGKGFKASGQIKVSNGKLSSAKFSNLALNAGDSIKLDVTRSGDTYKVNVVGTSYDARAVIKSIVSGAKKAKTDIKQSGGFNLTLAIANLKGFNKEVLRNASAKLNYVSGQLRGLELSGAIAKSSKLNISIQPKASAMETKFTTTNAGAAFNFFDIYTKMRGGTSNATLTKTGNGPYIGDITFRDFVIVHEPRLKQLVTQPVKDYTGRDKSLPIDPSAVKFIKANADLEKGEGYLKVNRGLIRNDTIGSSFRGTVFNQQDQMKLVGTFMPAYGINRLFGKIPLLGILLGNGTEGGLFGITYKLEGNAKDPKLFLNPLSIVTPGIFREIFQFK